MTEKKPWTKDLAYIRTNISKDTLSSFIKRAEKAKADTDKKARREASECRCCFYLFDRMGAAGNFKAACRICDKEMSFVTTTLDVLCLDCAKKHELCTRCGGQVDLSLRKLRGLDHGRKE